MATYNVTLDRAHNCAIRENIVIETTTVVAAAGTATGDLISAQKRIAELEAQVADLETRLIRAYGDGATWRDRYQTLVATLRE